MAPIEPEYCDRHWRLPIVDQDGELLRRIQEPDPNVVLPRGRPRNGPIDPQNNRRDNSTRRNLSHDEEPGRIGPRGNIQRPSGGGRGGGAGGRATLTNRVTSMEGMLQRILERMDGGGGDRQEGSFCFFCNSLSACGRVGYGAARLRLAILFYLYLNTAF